MNFICLDAMGKEPTMSIPHIVTGIGELIEVSLSEGCLTIGACTTTDFNLHNTCFRTYIALLNVMQASAMQLQLTYIALF